MNTLATVATLLTLTAVAAAEPGEPPPVTTANTYLAAGASLGAQRAIQAAVFVDGGQRLGTSALFARGQLTAGKSGNDGTFWQLRAGAEGRTCGMSNWVCAFAGADVGYQRDRAIDGGGFTDMPVDVDAKDLILVPRGGVEVGRTIRLRAELEMIASKRVDINLDGDSAQTGRGGAFSLALGGMF